MSGGLAGFSPRVYTEWVPRKGAETEGSTHTHQHPADWKYTKENMLTGIHRQNHIRVVLVSEEALPDKVLHLCDGCAALKTGGQQEW